MVDRPRWEPWLTLRAYARSRGQVMTLGDYSLAVATDNCVGIQNADQSDVDADGIGDPCDVERIDIKPGSDTNAVNPRSRGVIPVAIYGTDALLVENIDVTSLRFGPGAAIPAHGGHLEDIDGGGHTDLLTHYRTQASGIMEGDDRACLSGVIAGTSFVACDSVRTVPPPRAAAAGKASRRGRGQ